MADVFVSYSRSDKARVAPIVAALEAQGWSVWWDPAIAPGQQFDRMIAEELESARAVLVVWTPDSVQSRWVRGEAREGADRGILVPVQLGPARLPIDFRAFHTTDLSQPGNVIANPGFEEVIRAVGSLVGRADAPSAASPVPQPADSGTGAGPPRIAICVLPLTNLGDDQEQQYFSDGITADIITELSRWRLLAVRSRSSSFKYRGSAVDPMQVARELNVRFIIEGTVRRIGDRVRVSVQLIDAETGNHVWGERFDRAQAEIFSVQDEVVQTIVSTLVGRVHVSDAERARRKPPASLDAYECVLEGNALFWDEPAGAAEAKRLFERAIELDPGYGLAHALLGTMKRQEWRDEPGDSRALLDEAYRLALRAIELDDRDSSCHSMLAQTCLYRRQFDLALEHMQRSVELNPNNQWNVADMGMVLMYLGRAEEAVAWNQRARQIDPYFDQPWYWRQWGLACMVLGKYEDALKLFAHHRVSKYYIAAFMAGCQARLGDLQRARSSVAGCLSLKPDFSVQRWMAKEAFKLEADAERIAASMRLAGLPD